MSYQSNEIPNIRTIKALRGEALRIDLGKVFTGTLTAWMKRDPNDLEYRSFEVREGRYLYLSKNKASDYSEGGIITSAIEGKWYFDVEQDLGNGSDIKTIFRGTILFVNDVTGSAGSEGIPPPDGRYRTIDIVLVDPLTESLSGGAETQQETNVELVSAIKRIDGTKETSAYSFMSDEANLIPGKFGFNAEAFEDTTLIKIHKIDADGIDNSYFIEALEVGSFLTFNDKNTTHAVVFEITSKAIAVGDSYEIGVIMNTSSGVAFEDGAYVDIDGLISAVGGGNITEDINVFGVGVVGGYSPGDKVLNGTPVTAVFKKLFQKLISLIYPTASLSLNPSTTQEVGATINIISTPSFTKNDSGGFSQIVYKKGGVDLLTKYDLTPYTFANQVIVFGNNSFQASLSYLEGIVDLQKDGIVPAGTLNLLTNLPGDYRKWFGPVGNSAPVNNSGIRSLSYSYGTTFTLNTGTSATYFLIAIQASKSIVSINDQDSLNAPLINDYQLSGTINIVPDGGGNPVPYKVYILHTTVPYSTSHRHNIITT